MSVRRKEIGVIQAEIAVSSRKVGDSGVRNVYVRVFEQCWYIDERESNGI